MNPVMDMLRDGTAELHRAAEHQEFQQRLAHGDLGRREYAAWLGQMLHVHRALESSLARQRAVDRRFAAVVVAHFKEPFLLADLAALATAPPAPLGATARLVARLAAAEQDQPLRLLGYHYVLEGSNNGNRMIARRLLPALGLTRDAGGSYLDPYGERQRELWAEFKATMIAIDFSPAERDILVEGAREMFAAIGDLSRELLAAPAT